MTTLRVRVAIVSFRRVDLLMTLLRGLRDQDKNWEICVWDNYSESSDLLRRTLRTVDLADWTHFSSENVGFAQAVNRIAALPGSWDVLLTVNPDTELVSSLEPLVSICREKDVAAVGSCSYKSGQPDCSNAYRDVGPFGLAIRAISGRGHERLITHSFIGGSRQIEGWIEGSLLAISRKSWSDVGTFDETFFLYSEEQDWQRRARLRGWRIVQVTEPLFVHASKGSVSGDPQLERRSSQLEEQSRRHYIRKWWGRRGLYMYRAISETGYFAKSALSLSFRNGR